MDSLITIFLPLALAVIMFSLGLGLTVADFRRVAAQPKAFGIGAFSQLVMIPVVAYAIVNLFGLSGELAVGLMILSFCPGGVTSNILTKIARGDLARARLASAEQQVLSRQYPQALASATAAEAALPRGTPDWLRAQDIAFQARAAVERDRKKR